MCVGRESSHTWVVFSTTQKRHKLPALFSPAQEKGENIGRPRAQRRNDEKGSARGFASTEAPHLCARDPAKEAAATFF